MAAAKRRDIASTPAPAQEEEMLKLYSERLVRKLEQKMLELEKEVQARQEAEETLRASERKYRLLADNTLDVIWAMDLDLAFTYVNPAIQSLMGYTPEEWIGSRLPEHCDEENFAKMVQVIADEVARGPDGAGVILEAVLLNKNREPIPVEIHGKVIFDQNGAPIFLQGTTRNISERKRSEKTRKDLESQLHQAQKMEAVGRLAGGVAHDFNNLLTIIIGNAELALMDVGKDNPLREELEEIRRAGTKAAELTRQLLAFSRKQIILPAIMDINKLLKDSMRMLGRLIGEDVEVVTIPEPALWHVEIDPGQMEQVIINLAVNARDAMPKGGKLTIETANTGSGRELFFAARHCSVPRPLCDDGRK